MQVGITINGAQQEAEVDPRTCWWTCPRPRRADRHEDRLRHLSVRVVHGSPRRQGREVVHRAAAQADGATVTTIEGLATNGPLRSRAFHEKHGLQCGFCTPGMIMAAVNLLVVSPQPTDEEIRHALEGTCAAAPATRTSFEPSTRLRR